MTTVELQNQLKRETKYSKMYISIIAKAQSHNRQKTKKHQPNYTYFENHHILPKSIFPVFDDIKRYSWNFVLLTPREHFLCHLLIWKHYKSIRCVVGERKMSYALRYMNNTNEYNSKHYEKCKLNLYHSEETKEKIRNQRKLQAPMSAASKIKCGDTSRNKIWTLNQGRINKCDIDNDTIIGRDVSWAANTVLVKIKTTSEIKKISKEEYHNNKELYYTFGGRKETTVGTTVVYNEYGEKVRVTIEEKKKRNLVSINAMENNPRSVYLELYNKHHILINVKPKNEKIVDFCKRVCIDPTDCRKSYLYNKEFSKTKKSKYFSKNGWYVKQSNL